MKMKPLLPEQVKLIDNFLDLISYKFGDVHYKEIDINGTEYTLGNLRGFLSRVKIDEQYDTRVEILLNDIRKEFYEDLKLYYYTFNGKQERMYKDPYT